MLRPTFPIPPPWQPTGRRLDRAECSQCDWEHEAAQAIINDCHSHFNETGHTIYLYRGIEYMLRPNPANPLERQ